MFPLFSDQCSVMSHAIPLCCTADISWTFPLSSIDIQFIQVLYYRFGLWADAFIKYLVVFMCDVLYCLRVVIRFVPVLTYFSNIRMKSIFILTGLVLFLQASSQNCKNQLLPLSFLSVFLSARDSLYAHGTTRLPLDGFSWKLIFEDFSKICPENSSFIKIWQE